MDVEKEKKAIIPVLKEMKVGDVESYPIDRVDTVIQSIGRYCRRFRARGYHFKTWCEELEVKVERVR